MGFYGYAFGAECGRKIRNIGLHYYNMYFCGVRIARHVRRTAMPSARPDKFKTVSRRPLRPELWRRFLVLRIPVC